jgi:hypothetical protein
VGGNTGVGGIPTHDPTFAERVGENRRNIESFAWIHCGLDHLVASRFVSVPCSPKTWVNGE